MANLMIIKELAREKKISLEELANDIGMTKQGFHQLIRKNSTKIETLEQIASKLGVSPTIFFDDDKKESTSTGNVEVPKDFLEMLKQQLEVIASQQRTIEKLSQKGGVLAGGQSHAAQGEAALG